MDDGFEERTEQASQQRREEFRNMGQVAQSKEIVSILVLFGVSLVFYFYSRTVLKELMGLLNLSLTDYLHNAARNHELIPALKQAGLSLVKIIAPVFAVAGIMGILGTVGQIGFVTAWEKLAPDLNHINPVEGFKRLFAFRNVVEGVKAVIKIVIVSTVTYMILKNEIKFTPHLVDLSVPQIFWYIGKVTFKLVGGICALMALMAILDYAFQRWELEKRMMMTKQEVKEEFKQREGDPMIRSRIRRIQRELAQKRMMEDVPKADVVITNPTHIAVVLKYDRVTMAAPKLVAKGADHIAEKIKEIAKKHNIPIVENKPLARTIFKTIKIGEGIPKTLYNAVAEVLAYVYKLKGRMRQVSEDIARERGVAPQGPEVNI